MSELDDRDLHLVDSYCSGSLTDEEFKELEDSLRVKPKLRRTLAEYRGLESALRASASAGVISPAGIVNEELKTNKTPLLFPIYSMAAAIVILISVITVLMVTNTENNELATSETPALDNGVAVLMNSLDANWVNKALSPGESISPGKWELLSGQVEIEFYSGAAIVLEGPAILEVLSENGGILHNGKLRAEVPDHAHGFTITSADVKLVDLGTSFGMDVDQEKGTAVHVFEGEVELHDLEKNKEIKKLIAGEAQQISLSNNWSDIQLTPDAFLSSKDLKLEAEKRQNEGLAKWQKSFNNSLEDPRLIARYDFEQNSTKSRMLKNKSKIQTHGINGSIIGARWSEGHWPEKSALDFKRPGDRVRINIPGTYESITMSTWIRIDGFDNVFNSLLLSDGWDRMGAVHWQILKSGAVELAVFNGTGIHHNHRAPFKVKPSELGSWMHVAVTYDGKHEKVRHYRNGDLIGEVPVKGIVKLEIHRAQIGNWTPKGHNQIRNFNGRFDDFAIFGEVLSKQEVYKLYQNGRVE